MDLKIILILTLVAVLCECRSARMTKEWPPSGKRSLNPWNRMSKTNKRDLNPWNRMSKTGEKRDAQGAVESLNPFNRMAPPDTFMHNRMANVQKRDPECSNLPPTSHEDISAEEWDQQMRDCCKTWFTNGAIPRQTDPMVSRGCRDYI